jgi:hypothetical protein
MPNVNLKVDQLFANVQEAILVILTPTVSEILVLPILVVLMQFVKTTAMLLSANVLQTMLEIHMFLAHLIPVLKIPVALIPSVLSVVKDLSVDVFEDSLEVQTAELVVLLILAQLTTFAEQTLSAVTKEDVPHVIVSQDTRETPILAVSEETVSPTLNVEITKPVKITNVLIHVKLLADLELTAKQTTM